MTMKLVKARLYAGGDTTLRTLKKDLTGRFPKGDWTTGTSKPAAPDPATTESFQIVSRTTSPGTDPARPARIMVCEILAGSSASLSDLRSKIEKGFPSGPKNKYFESETLVKGGPADRAASFPNADWKEAYVYIYQ